MFNLKDFIKINGLKKSTVAELLFPDYDRPLEALSRLAKGRGKISFEQVLKLAEHTGIPIDVMCNGGGWKGYAQKGLMKFTNGDFTAVLNTETWVTTVSKIGTLRTETFSHGDKMKLKEYLDSLTKIINLC